METIWQGLVAMVVWGFWIAISTATALVALAIFTGPGSPRRNRGRHVLARRWLAKHGDHPDGP